MDKERLEILDRIKEYEKLGGAYFNKDVENDPPSKELKPDDVDYLYKKFKNKFKHFLGVRLGNKIRRDAKKKYQVELNGLENLKGLKGPLIITGNHFAHLESICETLVCKKINKHKKMYIVIKEGNFQMEGAYGFLFKYCDTLPLSSNIHTMKLFNEAVSEVLRKKHFILIYPEQSMWWNYEKPRPQLRGAATIAIKNNVPILPVFVTLTNQDTNDEFGFPLKKYTVNILKPIYPDLTKSLKEDSIRMTNENYEQCVKKYEEVYNKKLVYGDDYEEVL